MRYAVAFLQQYMATYDGQSGYDTYSDRVLIDDVLYGLGVALEADQYQFATGFDKFKQRLREHLGSVPNGPAEPR